MRPITHVEHIRDNVTRAMLRNGFANTHGTPLAHDVYTAACRLGNVQLAAHTDVWEALAVIHSLKLKPWWTP